MSGARGAVTAALGLVVLEALVTPNATGTAAGGIGAVFDTVARGIQAWFDPTKPAIPDLTAGITAQQTAAISTTKPNVVLASLPFNTVPQAPSAAAVYPPQ